MTIGILLWTRSYSQRVRTELPRKTLRMLSDFFVLEFINLLPRGPFIASLHSAGRYEYNRRIDKGHAHCFSSADGAPMNCIQKCLSATHHLQRDDVHYEVESTRSGDRYSTVWTCLSCQRKSQCLGAKLRTMARHKLSIESSRIIYFTIPQAALIHTMSANTPSQSTVSLSDYNAANY
jgi:hypothetical protein